MTTEVSSDPEKTASSDSSVNTRSDNFRFTLQPAKILLNALSTLADPEFNPSNRAVIQVGDPGFEIFVRRFNEPDNETVFALLRLNSAALGEFDCVNPVKKTVVLKPLFGSLDRFKDDDIVLVVRTFDGEREKIVFQFRYALENRIELDLIEDDPVVPLFPKVSYGDESVIASKDLKQLAESILKLDPKDRTYCVTVNVDSKTHLKVGTAEVETVTVDRVFWFVWRYWGMLVKATRSAKECTICLVRGPDKNVMLRFSLGEVGDLVFLHGQAVLIHDEMMITCTGQFNSLF